MEQSMEELAEMNIDQIDALASGIPSEDEKKEVSGKETAEVSTDNEQAVDDGATTGAVEGEEASGIAMKSGKGTIPYAVLKETREELAETKRRLEALESKKTYHANVTEDYSSLVAQADERIKTLAVAFDEGEKTLEEFQVGLLEATAEREKLFSAKIKAEIAHEMRAQAEQSEAEKAEAMWRQTVNTFLAGKPDGVDYTADATKFSELDAAVKMYASNPINSGKDHQWFLDKAHREVMENNGIQPVIKKEPPVKSESTKKAETPKEDKSPIFSLSDIPGGIVPDGGTEVEQVAALSGAALTNRFLNDPSQIDKILAGLK